MNGWPTAAAALLAAVTLEQSARPVAPIDAALADFWQASGDRTRHIERIIATGVDFDAVYARLAAGRAYSRGVLTLLLSSADFDFDRPIQVFVNDRTVVDGPIGKDVRALLKWAAADEDRTMLFGAELPIDVPAR